ncbi:MAG: peptidoglycan-binding domain-containing protein [Actinomycetota bacterium]
MDSLAYLQLALVYETSAEYKFFEGLNWNKLCSQSYRAFLSLAVILSVMSIASAGFALQQGDSGPQVQALQRQLRSRNYFNNSITGYYGSATEAAVRRFQQQANLQVDGIAGSATLRALGLVSTQSLDTPPSASITPVCRGFSFGDRGQSVNLLQQQLKHLGYFEGDVDGKFRERTRWAVTRFQQVNNLPSTGCADTATLEAIDASMRQALPTTSPNSVSQPQTTMSSNLALGDRGTDVEAVQQRLQQLNYFNAPVTGYFGGTTEAAVIQFQRDRRLAATGVVDRSTFLALQGNSPSAIAQPNFSGNPSVTLRSGDRGAAVTQLQMRLRELGYNPGAMDGVFGNDTKFAVRRFQEDQGLLANGIATPNTLSALFGLSSSNVLTTAAVPFGTISAANNLSRASVLELQRRLKAYGFYTGPLNGIYNNQTQTAIRQAQRRYGLSIDDILAGAF